MSTAQWLSLRITHNNPVVAKNTTVQNGASYSAPKRDESDD
jgi:hypothetical protein